MHFVRPGQRTAKRRRKWTRQRLASGMGGQMSAVVISRGVSVRGANVLHSGVSAGAVAARARHGLTCNSTPPSDAAQ